MRYDTPHEPSDRAFERLKQHSDKKFSKLTKTTVNTVTMTKSELDQLHKIAAERKQTLDEVIRSITSELCATPLQ